MSDKLRIALVVPDYHHKWDDDRHCRVQALRSLCKQGSVDIVVFPEAYEWQEGRELQHVADEWANYFDAPTIVGIGTDDGFQTAVYRNPKPKRGETATHLYVKHSTSEKLAFEWPAYHQVRHAMFAPIVLKGRHIAVQICHDMFFGLLGQCMKVRGADVFLDITGGGVNYRKWSNVIQGRSLELQAAFLCTMAKRPHEGGAARELAFHNGALLRAAARNFGREGFGGFATYELPAAPRTAGTTDAEQYEEQPYTDKRYRDITVATMSKAAGDVVVDRVTGALELSASRVNTIGGWRGFESAAGRIGVLLLELDSLKDGRVLYEQRSPKGTFDHHIVVYFSSDARLTFGDLLSLAKLRVIEHRIGVVVMAGDHREALKTNRYKNIQRFREIDGVFGFNAEFLGGTWSTAGTTPSLGIPDRFFSDYLGLLG